MRYASFVLDLELLSSLLLFSVKPNHVPIFYLISFVFLIRHRRLIAIVPILATIFLCQYIISPFFKLLDHEDDCVKYLRAAFSRENLERDSGNADTNAVKLVTDIVKQRPKLLPETIDLINQRLIDDCVNISFRALELLDKCMKANGFDFHFYVAKQALDRVEKLAVPNGRTHPKVQRKAADLIWQWESAFGSDTRLPGFRAASVRLSRHQMPRNSSRPPDATSNAGQTCQPQTRRLSAMSTTELLMLAKTSQRAIMEQMLAASDAEERQNLMELYNVLSKELKDYYARAEAGKAASASNRHCTSQSCWEQSPAASASNRHCSSQSCWEQDMTKELAAAGFDAARSGACGPGGESVLSSSQRRLTGEGNLG